VVAGSVPLMPYVVVDGAGAGVDAEHPVPA